jgi:hypothetical protein
MGSVWPRSCHHLRPTGRFVIIPLARLPCAAQRDRCFRKGCGRSVRHRTIPLALGDDVEEQVGLVARERQVADDRPRRDARGSTPCPRRRRSQAWGLRNRWFADSSLEGDGFEPSVPHKKQPFLAAPVRSRNSPSETKPGSFVSGTDGSNPSPSREESANHRFLSPHACDRP